jgi:tripartite-type tricarboxylate transporter receptor subunit TctC
VAKGTAPDRVQVLRRAFAKTMVDPDFLAEADKQRLTIIAPMEGEEAEKLLAEIYQSPADIVAEAKAISGE